jgi:hypothetical protein
MKSCLRLKALIVELPEIDSDRKLSSGDLVSDSTLFTSLFAAIVSLNSIPIMKNITGYNSAIQGTTYIDKTMIESVMYTATYKLPT